MSLLRRRMMMAFKTGASEETEGLSDYFHVISHEDQTIAFLVDCQYNLDDGNGWIDLHSDTEINLPKDAIIYVSALANKYSNIMLEYAENISLAGNIMSLVYGHDFRDKYSLEGFDSIFAGFASSEINPLAIKSIDKLLLPATTLSYGCYSYMFYACENITKAPVLPAPVLEEFCYAGMFSNCKNLNYIKMLATGISTEDCLYYWVENVSSTGTFVKSKDATWDTTPGALGDSGVPAGWTVVNDGEESGGGNDFGIEFPLYLEFDECETSWGMIACTRYADDISKRLYEVLSDILSEYGTVTEVYETHVSEQVLNMLGIEIYIKNIKVSLVGRWLDNWLDLSLTDGGIAELAKSGELRQDFVI